MRRLLPGLLLLPLLLAFGNPAGAQVPLVADLSRHLVAITTGFTGTDVLLFGATDGPGDVIVIVRGPDRPETVRRKERIAGIWANRAKLDYDSAPTFYRLAASRPLAEIAGQSGSGDFQRHQIGLENIRLVPADTVRPEEADSFRQAVIRLKQAKGLYGDKVGQVAFLGNQLFRTEVRFPANVPVGTYAVEVFLFRNGQVVSAQTTPLTISKIGIGADVYDFAHNWAWLYGIIAILVAALSGWLAAVAFKKG